MKNTIWRVFALLCLTVLCVTGCDWFNAVDDGKIPQGVMFYTGCPVDFFFIDEDGNDLVDAQQARTYPLAFQYYADEDARVQAVMQIQTVTQRVDGVPTEVYSYNGGSNWIWKDNQEGLHAFRSYLWGKTPNTEFMMLVYTPQNATPDSLKLKYKYLTGKEDPKLEGTWGVEVTSIRYKDVEVLEGNENGKVFIVKPSHGETTVKVGSR